MPCRVPCCGYDKRAARASALVDAFIVWRLGSGFQARSEATSGGGVTQELIFLDTRLLSNNNIVCLQTSLASEARVRLLPPLIVASPLRLMLGYY